jgi:predicted XRE-type DNA-binding protein
MREWVKPPPAAAGFDSKDARQREPDGLRETGRPERSVFRQFPEFPAQLDPVLHPIGLGLLEAQPFASGTASASRAALGAQVVNTLKERGCTQAEAAKLLGIKQPEVSALVCARFHRFSQERLIGFLNKLDLRVTLHISRHQQGEPFQQVAIGP